MQLDPSQIVPMDENAVQVVPYVFPLPLLAGDPWGTESLHPWVVEQLRKRQIEQEKWEALALQEAEQASKTNILGGPGAGSGAPMGSGAGMGSGMGRGMMPPGGRGMMPPGMMGPGGMGGAAEGTPLRRQDFILQFTWQPVVPGAPKPAADGDATAGTTGN